MSIGNALRVYAALDGAIAFGSLPTGVMTELEDARWIIAAAVHGIEQGE